MKSGYLLKIMLLIIMVPLSIWGQDMNTDDFEVKGFHLDLRIQVMTPGALKDFAKELAGFGMNTLVMEYEGTYPFKDHAIIGNKYSYTREEIKDFVSYCDGLGIQVIPLQQSLGHLEYILRNPRYSILKEDDKDISQLCPMEVEANRELFKDLFADMAAMHNSDYIHIGGDETRLLGHCEKCQKKVEEEGKSKLFVDHMKMIAQLVIDLGKKPVMWADIILKHPEAARELPKETIFVDWNYGWKVNHFGDIPKLQELGFIFWGAPSIRSHPDNWYITNWKTHFNNQRDFIPYSREAGYKGMVMTSWSTSGLYGFTWDVGYDVVDMVQIRNNYPLSGFRILIASYAEALKSKEPIDPEQFVSAYAKKRFGLNNAEIERFKDFLFWSPELIEDGKPIKTKSVKLLKEKYAKIQEQINQIDPKEHKTEFDHYRLMADLRMNYLSFKEIEAQYNSPGFVMAQTPQVLNALETVIKDAHKLSKKFTSLNKGFLYDAEIKEQNEIRIQPMKVLRDRLAKLK